LGSLRAKKEDADQHEANTACSYPIEHCLLDAVAERLVQHVKPGSTIEPGPLQNSDAVAFSRRHSCCIESPELAGGQALLPRVTAAAVMLQPSTAPDWAKQTKQDTR